MKHVFIIFLISLNIYLFTTERLEYNLKIIFRSFADKILNNHLNLTIVRLLIAAFQILSSIQFFSITCR